MTAVVVTPTVGTALRRSLFWIGAVTIALGLAVLLTVLNGVSTSTDRWDPESPAPTGSRALATVLGEQGIDVQVTTTRTSAVAAIDDAVAAGDPVTLLVTDWRGLLTGDDVAGFTGLADRLVLAEPAAPVLDALDFPFATTRTVDGPLDAGPCALGAADRAGSIDGDAILLYTTEADVSCFVRDDGAALLTSTVNGAPVTVLGAGEALENGQIERAGNAALALGLLGEHPRLVWYSPSLSDVGVTTLADVTPGWVNPLAWILGTTLIAAALWRGRRLGPVVIENLPVVVKTTETMEGRARLYARGRAQLRALDALRVGTLRRLAHTLALGTAAGVDDIVTAAAATTGRDPRDLRTLLVDAQPTNDVELMRLGDQLAALERNVTARVALDDDPDPTGRMNG